METLVSTPLMRPRGVSACFLRSAERNSSIRFSEKLSARKGRSAYAPRAPSKASAEGKRKATHFREWLLVEVTGLEPVTLCRLVHDEPGCNREKEKALTFVSAWWWKLQGSNL